jgi:hypothetical protein
MAVSQRLQDATTELLMPKLVEGVLVGNTGLSYFLARSKAADWEGYQIRQPFKWQASTNGSSFSGFDALSTTPDNNTISLIYNCAFNEMPVSLPKSDIAVNNTEKKVADLMERQIASNTYDMANNLGTQFYADGTGNGGKDILGLAAIVDDGTNVATIGGQSRATYPALDGTVTASGGTLTLAKMYTLHDDVTEGSQEPDLILTTKTIYSLIQQLNLPYQRYMVDVKSSDKLFLGSQVPMFRGAMVVKDSKCPTGKLFMLNSDSFQFHTLRNWPGAKKVSFAMESMDGEPSPDVPEGLGFFWSDWVQAINQEAYVGRVIHGGNFVVKNPRYNGVLTGITGI